MENLDWKSGTVSRGEIDHWGEFIPRMHHAFHVFNFIGLGQKQRGVSDKNIIVTSEIIIW